MSGTIRRRMLVNYRVDADVMARHLPSPFKPKLHAGFAIAGICLIRLEHIRPLGVPGIVGLASENAAHRIAVTWTEPSGEEREGVYVPRRDTDSWINHVVGGRIFPGEHQAATFHVTDDGTNIDFSLRSNDGVVAVALRAHAGSDALSPSSCFGSLDASSKFFADGSVGYSVTHDAGRFDGIELRTRHWVVKPLDVESVTSTYFDNTDVFPPGSISFDHALIMRDIEHEWHGVGDKFSV